MAYDGDKIQQFVIDHLKAELARADEAWYRVTDAALIEFLIAEAGRHMPNRVVDGWYWPERRCSACDWGWHWVASSPTPTTIGDERGCPFLRGLAIIFEDETGFQESWKRTLEEDRRLARD